MLPSGHKRDFSGEVGASAADRCIDIGEAAFIMELVFLEIRKIIVRFVLSIFNEVQFRAFIKRKRLFRALFLNSKAILMLPSRNFFEKSLKF